MRKDNVAKTNPRRVLARVLAEDLKLVRGGCPCNPETKTPEVTGGGSDITNTGPDGD